MTLSRRHLLFTTALIAPLAMTACGANAATTDAQVLADASGITNGVLTAVTQVNSFKPGAVSASIVTGLQAAQGFVASLSTATPAPTGATTLQKVDTFINNGVTALASVLPALSILFAPLAGVIPVVDGAIALLPSVEAWVNPLITSVGATPVVIPAPIKVAYTVAAARAKLGVPVVK